MSGAAAMWSEADWDAYHDRVAERESEEITQVEDEFLELAARVGAEHPESLAAHVSLLRLFDAEASVDPLLDSSAESLAAACARVLGPDHDLTFEMREFAAVADFYRGNTERGLTRLSALLADRTAASGADAEATLALRVRRARVLTVGLKSGDEEITGVPAGWDTEWTALIDDATRALGRDHPLTLEARTWLAHDACEMGDSVREEALYGELAADRARIQGPEHEDTLTARERQLSCTVSHGEPGPLTAEFEEAAQALIEDCVRVLGAEHPLTQSSMMLLAGPSEG